MLHSITLRNYRGIGHRGLEIPLNQAFVGLIGVNNSGKSTALRALYELRPLFLWLQQFGQDPQLDVLSAFLRPSGYPLGTHVNILPGERIFPANDRLSEPIIELTFSHSRETTSIDITTFSLKFKRNGHATMTITTPTGVTRDSARVDHGTFEGRPCLQSTETTGQALVFDWRSCMVEVGDLADSMYVGPFRNAINSGGATYYDLQVGSSFYALFNEFLNGQNYESNEAMASMLDELSQIFGFRSLDIGVTPTADAFRYTIDGKSMRGSELGAGIAQFVIVAANVLTRKPTFLLIDEPELNLHASLQMRFLSLLAQYARGPVIFATHSVGLARSIADRTIVVTATDDGTSFGQDWSASPNLPVMLGEMGYGGFRDTSFKAVLLVEGVTEVRTMQEWLIKWGVRNEVVILPLGGDTLAIGDRGEEVRQLSLLSDSVYAVVDGEVDSSGVPAPRRLEFQKTCEALGIDCLVLERKSTENYLNQETAREVMKSRDGHPFGHYEKPGAEWSWRKGNNWRIAREMSKEELEGTDLGGFLGRMCRHILESA